MGRSLTRRGVLTGAAAIAGVTALPKLLHLRTIEAAAATPRTQRAAIYHVVVDGRCAASACFASGFHQPRIHVVSALDDLCHHWYTRLRTEVLANAGHVAGMTTWMDYVVMRSCAAEIGYRRAFHADHVDASGLRVVTWVFSPRSV
jgi:hypothetical protein